jgi:hypothetical protein
MICLGNVVELAKIAILSTAKSFVFFSFSFNALFQHSQLRNRKEQTLSLSSLLLASVRLEFLRPEASQKIQEQTLFPGLK